MIEQYDWLLEQEREIRLWYMVERNKMEHDKAIFADPNTQTAYKYEKKNGPYKKRKKGKSR